jgi:hypothetical protein
MTIAIRNFHDGNDAHYTFETPEDAVNHIQHNPSYEIIHEDQPVRPYGDIDLKDFEGTRQEFDKLDRLVHDQIAELFRSIDTPITLITASSYKYRKISWNWVVPNVYVKSYRHAKEFAKHIYEQLVFPECIKLDYSVYSRNKKMRMVGTSKPNENRPKKIVVFANNPWVVDDLVKPHLEDSIITHIPAHAELVDIELPKHEQRERVVIEQTLITTIADQIKVERWTDYKTCLSLIYAMCSAGASDSVIHKYCAKASNYGEKWVDGVIDSHTSDNKVSIGTLIYYAKLDNPAFKVPNTNQSHFQEITQLTTNETTLYDWQTSRGFLKKLPNHQTQAVSSHMSTGKSTEMMRICKESKGNILMVSVRCSWTSGFITQLPNFHDYRDIKTRQIPNDMNVIVQLQSLHRVLNNTYDIVFLDEIESLLATLTPNKTFKDGVYMSCVNALSTIVKNAKRVVGLDAFLTDRSVRFLEALRGEVQIVINPHIPFNKTGTIYKSEREYLKVLKEELEDGKKICTVWGTKNAAEAFHGLNSENQVLYVGGTNNKSNHHELGHVNTSWAKYQHVGYTGTITVGINYTNEENQFDKCSFYASPWSFTSRDYFQALHRARKLNDDEVFGYVSTKERPCTVEAGLSVQAKMFNEESHRKKQFLEALGESPVDYANLPSWLKDVLIWNRNERITNWKHFEECMLGYGKLCGINFTSTGERDKQVKLDKANIEDVATIETICDEAAEFYMMNRNAMTEANNLELEKYFLSKFVRYINQDVWEMWRKNRRWISRTYTLLNSTPLHEVSNLTDKTIELLPNDIERLDIIQNKFKFDFSKSWSIPVEELQQVSLECFNLRVRTEKDTPDQYARDVKKAIESWNNTKLHVDRKRVRKGSELGYDYSLRYETEENQFYQIIVRNTDVFNDE